jgi:hypothetical protein
MTQTLSVGHKVEVRSGPHRGKRGTILKPPMVTVQIEGEPIQLDPDQLDTTHATRSDDRST